MCAAPVAHAFAREGIQLFRKADFGEYFDHWTIPEKIDAKRKIDDFGRDTRTISSVIVYPGVKATFYEDTGFRNAKITLYPGRYENLIDWNDRFASVILERIPDDLPLITLRFNDNHPQYLGFAGKDEFITDKSFLRVNGAVSIEIPDEYKVTLYSDPGYSGRSTSEPLDGGIHNMRTYGMKDDLSSLQIEWKKYKLRDTKLSSGKKLKDYPQEALSTHVRCDNLGSSATVTCSKDLTAEYASTYTTSWENSTSVGITSTTTVSVGVEVGVEGVASASSTLEQSIAIEIANEFSFGKSEEKSTSQSITDHVEVQLSPGQNVEFDMLVTPADYQYDVTYHYAPVDGNGPEKVIKGKITVRKATETTTKVRDVPRRQRVMSAP